MFINGHTIEGVIFDIDGTLVDSFPVYCAAFNKGIREYNLEPVPSQYLMDSMKRGEPLSEIFRKIFPAQTEDAVIENCRKEVLELFIKAEVNEVKLFPGVNELFQSLKNKDIKIGVATGRTSFPEKEWERFTRYGLEGFIDALVTSKEVERRKPAPDAILECAIRMKVSIENCLVVGDTDADILASRTAGAIAVAVSTGQDDIELLKKENPEYLFSSLVDLTLFLNNSLRR